MGEMPLIWQMSLLWGAGGTLHPPAFPWLWDRCLETQCGQDHLGPLFPELLSLAQCCDSDGPCHRAGPQEHLQVILSRGWSLRQVVSTESILKCGPCTSGSSSSSIQDVLSSSTRSPGVRGQNSIRTSTPEQSNGPGDLRNMAVEEPG